MMKSRHRDKQFSPVPADFELYAIEFQDADPADVALILGKRGVKDVARICDFLHGLKKAKGKLPSWVENGCVFPSRACEQSSGEEVAALRFQVSGDTALDLCCGLGVDALALSKRFNQVITLESNPQLAAIARFNFSRMNAENIHVIDRDALEFLRNNPDEKFDFVFADPDRRPEKDRRSLKFEDSSPDILQLLPELMGRSPFLMIKASPLFDLTEAGRILPGLIQSHVISIDNEIRETGFLLSAAELKKLPYRLIIGGSSSGDVLLNPMPERRIFHPIEKPGFIHEPDAAFYKAGVTFEYLQSEHTDFEGIVNAARGYGWSNHRASVFAGRIFEVSDIIPFRPAGISRFLRQRGISRINITRKGMEESVENIRKKLQISEGGDDFLLLTENPGGGRVAMLARRM